MSNPIDQFKAAITAAGLEVPNHIEPGRIIKFRGHQKSVSNKAAWCFMFDDLRGGVYGDYSTGMQSTWQASQSAPYTAEERQTHLANIKEAKARRKSEELARHALEASNAEARWHVGGPADGHAYLVRKGVKPHGIRQDGHVLLIPLRDTTAKLHSLQIITPDGEKRFKGRMKGCYHAIDGKPSDRLVVCEGYATGASIHEATGWPVAVAFNAGNLEPVAIALHKAYPSLQIVIAADDDHQTPGNPGKTAAQQAALAVGGLIVFPLFPAGRPDKATDFNDLAATAGLGALRACFSEIEEVTC